MRTGIKGMGIYLPEKVMTSEEVEIKAGYERLGVRKGLVRMITGVEERHYAAEDEYSSDLAYQAAKNAMEDAGITADEVDTLIFCSVTQDFAEPATANVIAEKLGLHNAYCFDVKNGCNAFLQGMDIADSLIKTGKAKNVVITSGEALSKWVRFDYDNKDDLMVGSPVTLSLGDGGGAFVIGQVADDKGIITSFFRTFPELWNNNVMWGGGVRYPREPEKMYIPGTTKPLIDKHLQIGTEFMAQALEKTGWTMDDVDFFASSQAAKWIVKKVSEETGVSPEKRSSVITKWGNAACANLPLVVYEARREGRIKEGSKVVFIGAAVGFNSCVFTIQF
ncbi:MAG: ketoacyl-ACP synthase III [Oscillospiraceae bacterium]|nr:ketoacyl-ACP synthase III [Oscillospiraceae bacterium]